MSATAWQQPGWGQPLPAADDAANDRVLFKVNVTTSLGTPTITVAADLVELGWSYALAFPFGL